MVQQGLLFGPTIVYISSLTFIFKIQVQDLNPYSDVSYLQSPLYRDTKEILQVHTQIIRFLLVSDILNILYITGQTMV